MVSKGRRLDAQKHPRTPTLRRFREEAAAVLDVADDKASHRPSAAGAPASKMAARQRDCGEPQPN